MLFLFSVELGVQPALHFASILSEHGWSLVALFKAEGATRCETTALRQVDQAWRLTRDEHRVRVAAQTRNACHQHLCIRMERSREKIARVPHFHDLSGVHD